LGAPSADCREAFDALALALVKEIQGAAKSQPEAEPRQPSGAPTTPEGAEPLPVPPPPAEPLPEPEAAPEPAASRTVFAAYAAGFGAVGLSPSPTGGGSLSLGARFGPLGIYLEGRLDAPVTIEGTSGTARTNLVLGGTQGCYETHGIGACLSLGAGALQMRGDVPLGRAWAPIVKIGARVKYELAVFRALGFFAHLDVGGVPTRVTVVANDTPVWTTSPVAGELALGTVVWW
jgi:hypothetical protein